jgi:hypothetical protein
LGYRYVKGSARLMAGADGSREGAVRLAVDFWRRTHSSREAIENLIRLGAFAFTACTSAS